MRTTITIIALSLFVAAPAAAAPRSPDCIGPFCSSPTVDLWPTCCFTGPKGSGTCKDLDYLEVCAIDSYCCTTAWDEQCVSEFESVTELVCPPIFHGVYTQAGYAEIAEWNDEVCGPGDEACLWGATFQLPAVRSVGSSSQVAALFTDYCTDGSGGIGGTGPDAMELVYNQNQIMRGVLHAQAIGDLGGACDSSEDALLFELRPQWTLRSCAAPQTTPGCNDPSVQECVCRYDDFCCEHAWDVVCVAESYAGWCSLGSPGPGQS